MKVISYKCLKAYIKENLFNMKETAKIIGIKNKNKQSCAMTSADEKNSDEKKLRILFACSSGGHLAQIVTMKPWYEKHDRLWVTFDTPDAKNVLKEEKVFWAKHCPDRKIGGLVKSVLLAFKILFRLRPRPDIVVSTGASIGAIFIILARLLGIATLYIEVFDRIEIPSMSGRICYHVADSFGVQWQEQQKLYPKSTVVGALL